MNRYIVRVALALSAVGSVAVPALFAPAVLPACLSSSGSSSGSSGSSGGGSGSGSSSGASGSSSGSTTDGPVVCLGPDAGPVDVSCVVDDMANPATLTGGYWYTYSDRTIPNTTTLVPGAAGIIDPVEGAQFLPDTTGTGGPMVPGLSSPVNFRTFTGSGLTLWGAGMGFDWKDLTPPSDSDAADASPALGVPIAFDASMHQGINFYGMSGTGKNQAASVHFSDSREAAAAGMCNSDAAYVVYDGGADTVNNPTECGDDFFKTVTFTPTWTSFTVKFSSTATQGYSGMVLTPKTLDTTKLYQIHFQVNNPGYAGKGPIAPEPAWDIRVAYITWYDGP